MKRSPEFYQRERLIGISRRFREVLRRVRPFKSPLWITASSVGRDTWASADRDRQAFDEALGRGKHGYDIRIRQNIDLTTHIYVDGKRLTNVTRLRIDQASQEQIILDVTIHVEWGTVTHRFPIRDLTIITPESFQ